MDTYIGRGVGPLRGGVTPAALAPQPPPPGPLPAEGGRKVPPARHEAVNLVNQRVCGPHAVGEQHDGLAAAAVVIYGSVGPPPTEPALKKDGNMPAPTPPCTTLSGMSWTRQTGSWTPEQLILYRAATTPEPPAGWLRMAFSRSKSGVARRGASRRPGARIANGSRRSPGAHVSQCRNRSSPHTSPSVWRSASKPADRKRYVGSAPPSRGGWDLRRCCGHLTWHAPADPRWPRTLLVDGSCGGSTVWGPSSLSLRAHNMLSLADLKPWGICWTWSGCFSLACLRTGGATAHFRRHRNLGRHGLQVTGLFLTGLVRGLAMNAWSLWTRVQHLDTAVGGSFAQAWQPPPPPYTTPSLRPCT